MVVWPLAFTVAFMVFDLISAQQISGYGPVDVAELNPLTLNWNQVQRLHTKLRKLFNTKRIVGRHFLNVRNFGMIPSAFLTKILTGEKRGAVRW